MHLMNLPWLYKVSRIRNRFLDQCLMLAIGARSKWTTRILSPSNVAMMQDRFDHEESTGLELAEEAEEVLLPRTAHLPVLGTGEAEVAALIKGEGDLVSHGLQAISRTRSRSCLL